ELLLVALGHTHDHVVDQGAGQAVQRAGLPLVVGTLHLDGAVLGALDGDRRDNVVAEGALRALHRDGATGDLDVDTRRDRDGELANARHASLPFWSRRAITRRRRGLRRPRPSG